MRKTKHSREIRFALVSLLISVTSCGSEEPAADPDAGAAAADGGAVADAAAPADGDLPGDWTRLLDGEWTVPRGAEIYKCVRKTITEDLYITSFRAVAPLGTHHTVLTVGAPNGADGVSDCSAATNSNAMIYGSGVQTNPIAFPAGVAMRVQAGQQLLLNLHLYNTSDSPISGLSGTDVIAVPMSEVQEVAEVILMGKTFQLSVPTGESTQVGTCRMNGDVTIFAVGPHMHQLGTHMKVVAESSVDGTVDILDQPYDFLEQTVYPITSIRMKQNDAIKVHCTYDNNTGSTVSFGDSSDDEMCFAGIYRYPARGGTTGIICDSFF